MGATIVDGLDTLYIMELMDEYKKGRDWVAKSLSFQWVSQTIDEILVICFIFPSWRSGRKDFCSNILLKIKVASVIKSDVFKKG